MATLMEKDVLIEYVSYATALIAGKTNNEHPQKKEMWELKNYLYDTKPENINYDEIVSKVKPIIDELEYLPECEDYNNE